MSGKTAPRPGERNNFDLLRFVLALVVVAFHMRELSASPGLRWLWWADGNLAVLGFFAISGYVVSASWNRNPDWRTYGLRRARRLLPAYFTVVAVAFLAGSLLSSLPVFEYFASAATWKYLAANLSMLNFLAPSLPGVFTRNPVLPAVNGSLWSIRAEALCYVLVPAFALLSDKVWPHLPARVWFRLAAFVALGAAAVPLFEAASRGEPFADVFRIGLLNPLQSFFLGMAVHAAGPRLCDGLAARRMWLAAGAAALVLIAWQPRGLFDWLPPSVWFAWGYPLAAAILVLAAGLALPYLGNATRLGSLSYGLYLWHFPIVQFAVSKGWFLTAPLLAAAGCLAVSCICAAASWHWIERPFLRPENHYRRLTRQS